VSQHPTSAQRYVEGMIQALRTRDPRIFADFLIKSGRGNPTFAKDPRKLEQAMHRFILTFPELSDLHEESRRWLADHPESMV
jgi:tRNA isopentenyl-2-thiomethyl-A-37 hydroxylase MiaE